MLISELEAKLKAIREEHGDLDVCMNSDATIEAIMVYTYPGICQFVQVLSPSMYATIKEFSKNNELFQKAHRVIE